LSCWFSAGVDHLVAYNADVRRYPVDADTEGAADTEESGKDRMESGEEVLAGLGFGGSKRGDGGLAINEDIRVCQTRRARDDVERKDRPTDFRFRDCVLTF
jgi:hypothetical protein